MSSTYLTLVGSEPIGTVLRRKLCIDEARTRLKQLKVKSLTEMWPGELLQTSGFLSFFPSCYMPSEHLCHSRHIPSVDVLRFVDLIPLQVFLPAISFGF